MIWRPARHKADQPASCKTQFYYILQATEIFGDLLLVQLQAKLLAGLEWQTKL